MTYNQLKNITKTLQPYGVGVLQLFAYMSVFAGAKGRIFPAVKGMKCH